MKRVTGEDVIAAEEYAARVHRGDSGGHDILHIKRVIKNARRLFRAYPQADRELVLLCCALHDVDDSKLKPADEPEFSRLNAFMTERGFDETLCKTITSIIGGVAFSKNPQKCEGLSLEAQLVQDADRLDALGAVGIARAFAYGGRAGRAMYGDGSATVAHFYDKLFKLPELMNTAEARGEAVLRAEYMRGFLERFKSETDGE